MYIVTTIVFALKITDLLGTAINEEEIVPDEYSLVTASIANTASVIWTRPSELAVRLQIENVPKDATASSITA
jgi:hypothetical protein